MINITFMSRATSGEGEREWDYGRELRGSSTVSLIIYKIDTT